MAVRDIDPVPMPGERIRVRGLVQGVGFRPTVWRLARDCGLSGEVRNDAEGVLIRAWGEPAARRRFLQRLREEAPPLARIDEVACTLIEEPVRESGFHIAASETGGAHTGVAADAATCPACLEEVLDRADRRHRYAFTNCTHCGPRLSIVMGIPYDRANTSMGVFDMCPACRREYEDPANRRFHAQPNACSECGPRLWLEPVGETSLDTAGEPVEAARRLLRGGHIVAVKGIGGIHLACDAGNAQAVDRLRRRKHRYDKPFALMAGDVDIIRRYCAVSDTELQALRGPAAPIVLLDALDGATLTPGVAPGQRCYGFMLPYSPLHHLLLTGLDTPIVLTSGNRSEEPQCIDNERARAQLADIADVLLLHDREIINRLDDSVVRVTAGAPSLIRRARGYAPAPLRMPGGFADAPRVLAFGGELKNTFCLLRDGGAILSQHLGDLENAAAHTAYRQALELYQDLFDHRPQVLAIDQHPEYLPAKLGRERAEADGTPLIAVQHHHAHVAACMADNGLDIDAPPVLGIALDGLGYGEDGALWGGELLLADYAGARRIASLAPVPLPGGARAIHEPWRMAYACLRATGDWTRLERYGTGLAFFRMLQDKPLGMLARMLDAGLNCPLTSSCGRLFDAVAAVCGLRWTATYEGQAAIELEAAVDPAGLNDGRAYAFDVGDRDELPLLDPRPMWRSLLGDLEAGLSTGVVSARFHAGLAAAIGEMIERLTARHGDAWGGRVALSGGVFQNRILSEMLIRRLEARGLVVLRHRRVPANDGGLSLGQAAVAAARSLWEHGHERGEGQRACA